MFRSHVRTGSSWCGSSMALMSGLLLFGLMVNFSKQILCQEFEDLNQQQQQTQTRRLTNGGGNIQFAPGIQSQQLLPQSQFSNSRQFGPLPPPPPPSPVPVAPQQQQAPQAISIQSQQQATTGRVSATAQSAFQRTNMPSRFAAAQSSLANPQMASSQQQAVVTAAAGQQLSPAANADQIMKNALARTAKLEQIESRQDSPAPAIAAVEAPQSRQAIADKQQATSVVNQQERQSTPPEATSETGAMDGGDTQATTTASHETVYSDQRFANLFARRKTLNKSKFTPMETTRAKPTLPSFIKSPPDPKQFTASELGEPGLPAPRPVAAASSATLVAARPNNRLNINATPTNKINPQQKKTATGAITSNSAALANNKRTSGLNGKPPIAAGSSSSQKANQAKDPKSQTAATAPTASRPASSNPFSRTNNGGNDQANVIAMARKRLLANNALESSKLKQQAKPIPSTS